MSGFYLTELRLTGLNKINATITFQQGANVISGPSNTGKTFIFETIEYMLGSTKLDRRIKESIGYDTIFLEIKDYNGNKYTLKTDFDAGDFHKFNCSIDEISIETTFDVLKRDHSPGNKDTLSYFLLKLCGIEGNKVRLNSSGKTRELSFRDLRILNLVNELRVPTKDSPFLTGQYLSKTVEQSVMRFLLSGLDDSKIIESVSEKTLANRKGRIEMLIELIGVEKSKMDKNISKDGIEKSIEEKEQQLEKIKDYREILIVEFQKIDNKKKELMLEDENYAKRKNELTLLSENSKILEKQYASDKKRLSSTIETSLALMQKDTYRCPTCLSSIEKPSIDKINEIEQCANIEKGKIDDLLQELKKAQENFDTELKEIEEKKASLSKSIIDLVNSTNIKDKLDIINEQFSVIQKQKYELKSELEILNRLDNLEKQKFLIEQFVEKAPSKNREFNSITASLMDPILKKMYQLLKDWGYPQISSVAFYEKEMDFIISGEDRKLAGKGFRAITFASFLLSLNLETIEKNNKLGFSLIDSPLVTYRKPDTPKNEAITEDMAREFYKSLESIPADTQFIVIENEEFPRNLEKNVKHIHFTRNIKEGRYGFIPIG